MKWFHCIVVHCRYGKNLVQAKEYGIKKGIISGAGMGFLFLVFFSTYALAFWYGGKLVREEGYTVGRMLIVSLVFECTVHCVGKKRPPVYFSYNTVKN